MDLLWPAIGISAIVLIVLYALASHWQKLLRQQSWSLRRLADRVQVLEELGDPQFRRRLGECAPVPLDQVFNLSFRLNDYFWSGVLHLCDEDRNYVRTVGSIVGSVKLECWRSHTAVTVTEVLPDSQMARWQTRSLDFYPDPAGKADALTLWELRLGHPDGLSLKPPSLELILTRDAVELRGHLIDAPLSEDTSHDSIGSENWHKSRSSENEVTFFRVPLDTALLARYRGHDIANASANGNGTPSVGEDTATIMDGGAWQAFYFHRDDNLGIEWQLRLRDLTKKVEWERWRVLESTTAQYEPGEM